MFALTQYGKELNERMIAAGKTRWVAGCQNAVDVSMRRCMAASLHVMTPK